MDSKSSIPSTSSYPSENDPAPPPSYTDSTFISPSAFYSTQIRTQLTALSTQILTTQTQKSLLLHAQDEKILSLLTTQIQLYLSAFAASDLTKGSLILIPAAGLQDEKARPTHFDFSNEEAFDRVVRARCKEDSGHDEGANEEWFWKDEDMAVRLAGYLRPKPDADAALKKPMQLPPRKNDPVPPEQSNTTGRSFWGRKKSIKATPPPSPPPVVVDRKDAKAEAVSANEDKVIMDVRAEEVVFRTENEFGIFGTERGWGIVLRLKVLMNG